MIRIVLSGAIYPAHERCQRAGWLQGEIENVGSLRPRQIFSLTDRGRQVLEAHLSQPITQRVLEEL